MRTLTQSKINKIKIKPMIQERFGNFDNAELIDISDEEIIIEDLDTGNAYAIQYEYEKGDVFLNEYEAVALKEDLNRPATISEAVDSAFHIQTSEEDAASIILEVIKKRFRVGAKAKKKGMTVMREIVGMTDKSRKSQIRQKRWARSHHAQLVKTGNNPTAQRNRARALQRLARLGTLKRLHRFTHPGMKSKRDARHESIEYIEGNIFPFDKIEEYCGVVDHKKDDKKGDKKDKKKDKKEDKKVEERLAFTIDADEATYEINVSRKDGVAAPMASPMPPMPLSEPPTEQPGGDSLSLTPITSLASDTEVASTDSEDIGHDLSDEAIHDEGATMGPMDDYANESLIYIKESDGKWNPYFVTDNAVTLDTIIEARSVAINYRKNKVFEEKIAKLLAIANEKSIDEAKEKWQAFARNWSGLYLLDESEINDMFIYLLNKSYDKVDLVKEGMDIIREFLDYEAFANDRALYLTESGYDIEAAKEKQENDNRFINAVDSNQLVEMYQALTAMCEAPELENEFDMVNGYKTYANKIMEMVKSGFVEKDLISEILVYGFDIEEEPDKINEYIDDPDFILEDEVVTEDEDPLKERIEDLTYKIHANNFLDQLKERLSDIDEGTIGDESAALEEDINKLQKMIRTDIIDVEFLGEAKEKYGLKTVSGEPLFSAEHPEYKNQIGNPHQDSYEPGSAGNKAFPQASNGSVKGTGKADVGKDKYTKLAPSNKSNPEVRTPYDKGVGSVKTDLGKIGGPYYSDLFEGMNEEEIGLILELAGGVTSINDVVTKIDANNPGKQGVGDKTLGSFLKWYGQLRKVVPFVAKKQLADEGEFAQYWNKFYNMLLQKGSYANESIDTKGKKPSKKAIYKANVVGKPHDEKWKTSKIAGVKKEGGLNVVGEGFQDLVFLQAEKDFEDFPGGKEAFFEATEADKFNYIEDLNYGGEVNEKTGEPVLSEEEPWGTMDKTFEQDSLIMSFNKDKGYAALHKIVNESNPYYYLEEDGKGGGTDKGIKSNTKTVKDFPAPPEHPEYAHIAGDAKYKGEMGTGTHQEKYTEKGHAYKQTNKTFPKAGGGKVSK